jgi:hypothetical protein
MASADVKRKKPYLRNGFEEGSTSLVEARKAAATILANGDKASDEEWEELKKIWDRLYFAEGIAKIYRYHIGGSSSNTKEGRIFELVTGRIALPDSATWELIEPPQQPNSHSDEDDPEEKEDVDPKHARKSKSIATQSNRKKSGDHDPFSFPGDDKDIEGSNPKTTNKPVSKDSSIPSKEVVTSLYLKIVQEQLIKTRSITHKVNVNHLCDNLLTTLLIKSSMETIYHPSRVIMITPGEAVPGVDPRVYSFIAREVPLSVDAPCLLVVPPERLLLITLHPGPQSWFLGPPLQFIDHLINFLQREHLVLLSNTLRANVIRDTQDLTLNLILQEGKRASLRIVTVRTILAELNF